MDTMAELTIGDLILLARRHRGWNQQDLSRASGIPGATLSRYETNLNQPTAPQIRRLAAALGVDPNYLLGWPDATRVWRMAPENVGPFDLALA